MGTIVLAVSWDKIISPNFGNTANAEKRDLAGHLNVLTKIEMLIKSNSYIPRMYTGID